MSSEVNICRVCRDEGSEEFPLFHPCKCSGSIRFVHEDCLLNWLKHSNKKECELCGFNFNISPVYSESMPSRLPFFVFFKRAILHQYKFAILVFRSILVVFLWFILLPNAVLMSTKFFFWCSHAIATGTSTASIVSNLSEASAPTSYPTLAAQDTLKSSSILLISQSIFTSLFDFVSLLFYSISLSIRYLFGMISFSELPTFEFGNLFESLIIDKATISIILSIYADDEYNREADELYSEIYNNFEDFAKLLKINGRIQDSSEHRSFDHDLDDFLLERNHSANTKRIFNNQNLSYFQENNINNPESLHDQTHLDSPSGPSPNTLHLNSSDNDIPTSSSSKPSFIEDNISDSQDSESDPLEFLEEYFQVASDPSQLGFQDPSLRELNRHFDMDHANNFPIINEVDLPPPQNPDPDFRWPENQVEDAIDDAQIQEVADDLLQAFGFRGAFINGIQYLVLVYIIATMSVVVAACIPYILGKYLLNINIFGLPPIALNFFISTFFKIVDFSAELFFSIILPIKNKLSVCFYSSLLPLLGPSVKEHLGNIPFGNISTSLSSIPSYITLNFTKALHLVSSSSSVLSNWADMFFFYIDPILELIRSYKNSFFSFLKMTEELSLSSPKDSDQESLSSIIISVFFGYILILVLAGFLSILFKRKNSIVFKLSSTILKMAKISFFMTVQLVIFPIASGLVLDFSLVGLLKEYDAGASAQFSTEFPYSSLLIHWFVGIFYVSKFTLFVSSCRSVFRKGVLWFVRDGKNQNFEPIREIVDRPTTLLLKKVPPNFLAHTLPILLTVYPVVQILKHFASEYFPISLRFTVYPGEIPFDIVWGYFIIPSLLVVLKSRLAINKYMDYWWRFFSHKLRVSEFLIGTKVPSEMGVVKYSSFRSFINYSFGFQKLHEEIINLCWLVIMKNYEDPNLDFTAFPIPGQDTAYWISLANKNLSSIGDQHLLHITSKPHYCHLYFKYGKLFEALVNSVFESKLHGISFKLQGRVVRTPKNDSIEIVPYRKLVVTVRYNGVPENLNNHYSLIDSIAGRGGEQYLRRKYGISTNQSPVFKMDDYQYVFLPHFFRNRIIAIIMLFVATAAIIFGSCLYLPMVSGKIVSSALFNYNPNFLHSYCVGLSILLSLALCTPPFYNFCVVLAKYIGYQINKRISIFEKTSPGEQNEFDMKETFSRYLKVIKNSFWMGFMFGIVTPISLVLAVDFYIINLVDFYNASANFIGSIDILSYVETKNAFFEIHKSNIDASEPLGAFALSSTFLNKWFLAIILQKLFVKALLQFPNSYYSRVISESLLSNPPERWDVRRVYKEIFLPAMYSAIGFLALPVVLSSITDRLLIIFSALFSSLKLEAFFGLFLKDSELKQSELPTVFNYFVPSNRILLPIFCTIIYTGVFSFVPIYYLYKITIKFVQKLKDEEYIVGRQLHNIDDNQVPN
ncbi:hypothetical protein BB560_003231 [Smittium megazygosporum]|uniref:RING-type E3 ubiquitin transferase n=1 Tax=Smittium megazygosporum TaxID=133381 RepID=A0A2T9ZCL8_9FUNG|nr:hypothetical protein BB560_003231 [Smittium megazygosporum]